MFTQPKKDVADNFVDYFSKLLKKDSVFLHNASGLAQHQHLSIIGVDPLIKIKAKSVISQKSAEKELRGFYDLWGKYSEKRIYLSFFDNGRIKTRLFDKKKYRDLSPRFIGYFSYDFGAVLQGIDLKKKLSTSLPYFYFVLPSKYVFGNDSEMIFMAIGFSKRESEANLKDLLNKVFSSEKRENADFKVKGVRSNLTYPVYSQKIAKIKALLRSGDTYQVNFAQEFSADFEGDPFSLYRRLCKLNPSPFQVYFDFGKLKILSNSPERLICGKYQGKDLLLSSRPIKGTIGRKFLSDEKAIEKLLASEKDAAELMMIVDLVRNDLGRVSKIGSVKVTENRVVEKYSHLFHTMSNIEGILAEDKAFVDVVKAFFPGGSVTGCPKIRSMEIIDDLEKQSRGIYCGNAGYFSLAGEFDFNILIRSFCFLGDKLSFCSGGGIVYDSKARSEYFETMHKARALIASLN